jgi:hypothetical protein
VKQSRGSVRRHTGSASHPLRILQHVILQHVILQHVGKEGAGPLSRPAHRLCGRQLRQLITFAIRGCPSASGHLDCPIANVRRGCPIANARRRCPIANAGPS